MEYRDNISIVASTSGQELTSKHFRTIVRRPDSPEFMGFSDVTFTDEEHLSCLISEIFEGVERKATHDEVLRLAFKVKRDVSVVYSTFQRLSLEFTALVDDVELNFELNKPDLEWKNGQVCLGGDLYIFKERVIYHAQFYARLKVTVYGDGHIRLERDRRDVASPIEAVALMAEELATGRATPNPFCSAEQQLANDPESSS